MKGPRKAKSPYQKYGKAPYRYSELYRQWATARRSGHRDADALGLKHMEACAREKPLMIRPREGFGKSRVVSQLRSMIAA